MIEKKEASFEEVKDLILNIVKDRKRLLELGIGKDDSITKGYAKWFCSKKYNSLSVTNPLLLILIKM